MIKAVTAYTSEVDDVNAAVTEIMKQLEGAGLSGNSVGILLCYSDFIESGVVEALCGALPFSVVGSTTLGSTVGDADERITLSLMVLSGDGAEFAVGISEPLESAGEESLRRAYEAAAARMSGKPALMIGFAPLHVRASGDFYANAFMKIAPGVPLFGMLAVDNSSGYRAAGVIHRGKAYRDRYSFVLVGGKADPRFYVASISSHRIFVERSVVTEAKGNMLMSVNGRPVVEYLESLGLSKNQDGTITGVNSFPFVVDYNDGTRPVLRVIFDLTPEGHAVCGGDIPRNAMISVGEIDADEVLSTTSDALSRALSYRRAACVLMFSCVGRYFALDYRESAEMDLVRNIMGKSGVPYMFAYSGGEMCPVGRCGWDSGEITNRNHNDTLVVCTL